MGCHHNINYDRFPKQGDWLNREVRIMYHYADPEKGERPLGRIIRDDVEEPYVTIILLNDGRVILANECQYSPIAAVKGLTSCQK